MVDFLRTYWREILEVLAIVVSIVICCIKKKPVKVVDTAKETIIRLLPFCIMRAEKAPKGEKLAACLSFLETVLKDLGIILTDSYREFAIEQVELILSTPQKKEV